MSDTSPPLITVMTPTFNRVGTLGRLYESLLSQTLYDFEWLVVDDGSTDDTKHLIEKWKSDGSIPIRYLYQENAGKHVAFNLGVRQARGYFIAQIDSDDELLPDALSRMIEAWNNISRSQRSRFVGVTGLCVDESGNLVGTRFPEDVFVSDTIESFYRYGVRGEKWGIQIREVLLQYPFPEPKGINNLTMGTIWSKIAQHYQTLYINHPVRIYHSDQAAGRLTKRGMSANAPARFLAHQTMLNEHWDWFKTAPLSFVRSALQYGRSAFHLRYSLADQASGLRSTGARLLWMSAVPVCYLIFLWDRRKAKSAF